MSSARWLQAPSRAPAGHRYVRGAADILLIVVGSMVLDAVEHMVR